MYNLPSEIMANVPEDLRTPAKVRAFGEAAGYKLGSRGRIPREVYEKYAAQFTSPPETFEEALEDAVPF